MAKKKISENPKAVESRERKATSKKDGQAKEHAKAEDEFWEQAGEGAKSKASKKKEDQAKEREAAAAKKAEAKRLAAEEDAEMASLAKKTAKKAAEPKVTSHQLQLQQEAERKAQQAAVEEAAKAKKKVVTEDSYAQMVDTQNVNRNANDVEARSVTEALSALGVKEEEDKHPERRMKAAFAAYKERQMPLMKEEKPGLKQSQYQDMIFKAWQKSPANPLVQAQLAGSR
ncbi:hypothetical protein ABBQ38_004488 [Trebouxia sp. C0009 RCD-2024]